MKRILRIILLATCLASLTTSVRAQLEDDAGTLRTDRERARGATGVDKDEVKEPAGEPSIPPTRTGRTRRVLPLEKNPLRAPLKNKLSIPAAQVHA